MNGIGTWNLVSYLIRTLGVGGTVAATAITVGGILLCMIIPYLLGSLNFGVMISRRRFHDDVRTHGSGNAGATNMVRTYGWKAGLLTMIGDMLKAVVAVGLGYLIVGVNAQVTSDSGLAYRMVDQFGAAIAGLFVMLGHMFPVFFKFKGGKGVATSGIVIFMISPMAGAVCLLIFLVIVVGTRYVSLGSVMGLTFYPIILNAFSHAYDPPRNSTACLLSVLMAMLVVYMHRENIKRIMNRTESKISFKKKSSAKTTAETEETQA
ncbi:MAG: glycerol-3-phosphate 1-O-acyltransferase PlsY [Clostridia bacterium]|nr:glycerol-3-phosphate 1-O-acyltransferase PlsY [Clostridia bacterium]